MCCVDKTERGEILAIRTTSSLTRQSSRNERRQERTGAFGSGCEKVGPMSYEHEGGDDTPG